MGYKNFRIQCVGRVIMIGTTAYGLFYIVSQTSLYVTSTMVGMILIYQIVALINFIEKTNRDLTRFLEAIKHSDFSQSFTAKGLGRSFDELQSAFAEISNEFKKTRFEKE